MNISEVNARSLFQEYLFSKTDDIKNLSHEELMEDESLDAFLSPLKRTRFKDIDTILYSRLIEKALYLYPEVKTIIDLGAGSSIPTLLAVKNSGRTDIKIKAIDIDPDAELIGMENARLLNLKKNFSFHSGKMEEVLMELGPYDSQTLIVSNPPYIATPDLLNDHYFVPVNGGLFGDEYLKNILVYPYSPGVKLALLWGSLTSPNEILPLMDQKFTFIHTEIYRAPFGDNTRESNLKSYLYKLEDQGLVYFERNEKGTEDQYVFGNILEAGKTGSFLADE